jgi:hypothetical protein
MPKRGYSHAFKPSLIGGIRYFACLNSSSPRKEKSFSSEKNKISAFLLEFHFLASFPFFTLHPFFSSTSHLLFPSISLSYLFSSTPCTVMDIEPSYIHPSHSESPSSGHYADGPVRRDTRHTSPQVKQEQTAMEQDIPSDMAVKQEGTDDKQGGLLQGDELPLIKEELQEPNTTPVPQPTPLPRTMTTDESNDDTDDDHQQPDNNTDDSMVKMETSQQEGEDIPLQSSAATPSTVYTPAMYLARRDKRKSSPAVLGVLGLGEEEEAKLGHHLSKHRNSIEAAMLLANFNRPQEAKQSPEPEKSK